MATTINPELVDSKDLEIEANEVKIAYCVALNLILHKELKYATNTA